MAEKSNLSLVDRFRVQVEQRNLNDKALIEGPLCVFSLHDTATFWMIVRLADEYAISTYE